MILTTHAIREAKRYVSMLATGANPVFQRKSDVLHKRVKKVKVKLKVGTETSGKTKRKLRSAP